MSQLKAQRDESLRRDIQMRRNVKSRLQQQSNQTPPIMNQSHSTPKMGASGADQSPNSTSVPSSGQLTKTLTDRQTPTPAFPQKRLTEREICCCSKNYADPEKDSINATALAFGYVKSLHKQISAEDLTIAAKTHILRISF